MKLLMQSSIASSLPLRSKYYTQHPMNAVLTLSLLIFLMYGTRLENLATALQTDPGAHPASYPVGTGGYFLGSKVAGE
jgi:hypothetical protein